MQYRGYFMEFTPVTEIPRECDNGEVVYCAGFEIRLFRDFDCTEFPCGVTMRSAWASTRLKRGESWCGGISRIYRRRRKFHRRISAGMPLFTTRKPTPMCISWCILPTRKRGISRTPESKKSAAHSQTTFTVTSFKICIRSRLRCGISCAVKRKI